MFSSGGGELSLARFKTIRGTVDVGWDMWTYPFNGKLAWESPESRRILGVRYGSMFVALPYAHLLLLNIAALAIALRLRRFRLRTLFIATTFVALGLGLLRLWLVSG